MEGGGGGYDFCSNISIQDFRVSIYVQNKAL